MNGWPIVLGALLAGALAPPPASAQLPLAVRAFVGGASGYSEAFDPAGYCGRSTDGMERGLQVGTALGSRFAVTALQGWHVVRHEDRCLTPRFFPPFFDYTGEASFTGGDGRLAGARFASTRLRAEARLPMPGPIAPTASVGVGYIPSKSLWLRTAGVGTTIGTGPLRGILEWEGWWYEVSEVTVTGRFEEGRMVERSAVSTPVREFTGFLRIGVEWAVAVRAAERP